MIYDSVKNKDNYKEYGKLYRVLSYLENCEYPSDKVDLEEGIFLRPVELVSKDEEDTKFEAHKNYIDVHYIVEGVEGIATADVEDLDIIEEYNTDNDVMFLMGKEDGRYYLRKGDFMLCYPSDAHRVAIKESEKAPIKKIVVKIKY